MSKYDYEFSFPNGVFEQIIYDECGIADVPQRQSIIENKVNDILFLFKNVQGSFHAFATFTKTSEYTYKVTVKNPNYVKH